MTGFFICYNYGTSEKIISLEQIPFLFLSGERNNKLGADIKNFILIFLLVLFSSALSEASGCSTEEWQDSLSINDQHKLTMRLNEGINNNLFYFDKIEYDQYIKFSHDWNNQLYYDTDIEETEPGSINMLKQQQKLISALNMQNKFRMNTDLGLFGEILGYVNAAAVVSLMVVHLNKYYWNEEKKPPKPKKK